jgi:DNA-3-methyladenine glycosylase I
MTAMQTLPGPDGLPRCAWCLGTPEYLAYHDTEWGFPVTDDRRLFEKLCLEGFQSGLSWRTILMKRENFRAAFDGFDYRKMAAYTQSDVERLMQDAGIVRHRGKIEAVIHNARCMAELLETEGSLSDFVRRYTPEDRGDGMHLRSTCPESVALSKQLKRRGWKFVGPTTVYAFMQAMGLVNDHAAECVMRPKIDRQPS